MPPEYTEGADIHSSSLIGLKWKGMGIYKGMARPFGLIQPTPAKMNRKLK